VERQVLVSGDAGEVVRLIIAGIQVSMMDVRAPRNAAVVVLPHNPMQALTVALIVDAALVIRNAKELLDGFTNDDD
jgi:hypothetical protein